MDYQTALITGAGSGMGAAIAIELAGAGARVALVGRDRSKLERTRGQLGEGASRASIEPGDVADRAAVTGIVDRVHSAFGSIDILVCNAGINVVKRSLSDIDPADWDRTIATNLTGAFNLVQRVLPIMRAQKRGLIIQISSISGMRASLLGGVAYSASKFGQAALGLCAGREAREWGIKSTVIYPGEVETPILAARAVPVSAERRARILQPEDVAQAVRFLAELPARATVPELVLTPACDDFF